MRGALGFVLLAIASACDAGASSDASVESDAGEPRDVSEAPDSAEPADAPPMDAPSTDAAPPDAGLPRQPIDVERDRLLASYLAYLETRPDEAQSNGLRGADLTNVCELWARMPPSSQSVFLTLTARLGGARLGADGSLAIEHLTTLYRVAGGGGESATEIGSCGGGENNRAFFAMDDALHAALTAALDRRGEPGASGARDLSDVIVESFWRDSHDAAGPHDPFTASDETEGDKPRGQVHFFRDLASGPALAPLGRTDLEMLVDPHLLEMDQDYDCVHNSNPLCEYRLYGPACLPRDARTGTELYGDTYGVIDLGWRPSGC